MKPIRFFFPVIILALVLNGCTGRSNTQKAQNATDTITVADTGYTGIKQFMSGQYKVMEVTFKNGVREGLMKSFYQDGKVRQTFWYVNGLKQDSVKWLYTDGRVFRSTPYVNDTIDGIQVQYYKSGKKKAKIGFKKGFRTLFFEEYNSDGRKVTSYPEVVVNTKDNYKNNGTFTINLSLSDKSQKVKFYRGEFMNGVFDTVKCKKIATVNGTARIDMKKGSGTNQGYTGIIAQILTNFGNNYLVYKKIDLPYTDLK